MCIRVQYAALDGIRPWDATRQVITLPRELHGEFAVYALRRVLRVLDVEQDEDGARCWCGEPIRLPLIPQQRRSNEVSNLGA